MGLNSVITPSGHINMDAITPSMNGIQAKEMCSSGEEIVPKVRKPYIITKQRERWTEEEHDKFLEALKLYGRAWRRIEEYVGSKTAVQIRSHAQKFFSKVVRESAGSSTGSVKPIEIPPPRPKRKPVHPYPRKLGNSSHKGLSVLVQQEVSSPPSAAVFGQDNGSPTSVLSAIGSDIMGSSLSNLPNCCTSPDPSASGSNPVSTSMTEQENQCESRCSSAGEENGSRSPDSVTAGLASQDKYTMKSDLGCQNYACSEENSLVEAPAKTLKLFGTTVVVTDSFKPSSSAVGSNLQCHKSLPSVDGESHWKDIETDSESPTHILPGNGVWGDLCGSSLDNAAWNPWPCGVPPFFYRTPFQREFASATEAALAPPPLPWWSLYGGVPFPPVHLQNITAQQEPVTCTRRAPSDRELQKEGSNLTGSNTASSCEAGARDKNCDAVNTRREQQRSSDREEEEASPPTFHLKPSENSAFTRRKYSPGNQAKGFVPYERCFAEREVRRPKIEIEERESQRIRLCL